MKSEFLKSFFGLPFFLVFLLLVHTTWISAQEVETLLENVTVNYDSILFDYSSVVDKHEPYVLNHNQRNLLFNVEKEKDRYYSFYLVGYDKDWSSWSAHPVKEYTNLGSGHYELKVRTGSRGIIYPEESIFEFQIKSPVYLSPIFLVIYALLLVVIIWFIYRLLLNRHIQRQVMLEQLVLSRTEELKDEKEKTESLLANVLPKGTADEIMAKGKATKKKYNFVTVLFSDIQGFTRIAEEVNPEILIDELDKFFFYFDSVVEKYNIEKIKTIGDAYMCAGGIPKRNRTNPIEVILAALEMKEFMKDLKKNQEEKGQIFWDIRIGLHTGTVIAGVVGQKKLSYDIWGDTVNTASRMESSGEAGKINISGTTYDYAREFFICEYRGKMPVKYKGELDMYFVNGIRPELRSNEKNEPNDLFRDKMLMIKLLDLEDEVFELYESNGSKDLIFNDVRYLKNICTQAELIGRAERLDDKDIILLRLASIFVKSGYMIDYDGFESESARLLRRMAYDYGFSKKQIDSTEKVISEVFNEKPRSVLAMILSDSIYDYFGRVDYIIRLELLYAEQKSFVEVTDKRSWFMEQKELLSNHYFMSSTAKLLSTNSSVKQMEVLTEYIDQL